jgi:putative transposase
LLQRIDISGIIWNHCIVLHRTYYRLTGKHLNQFELIGHIVKLKRRPAYAFWKMVNAQVIQDIVERIERAYMLFFRNLKMGVKTAPPGFKKVKKYSSFTLKQNGWKLLDGNRIRIQDRIYKFSKSRDIPTNIKTVTIKRDNLGNLWIYFVIELLEDQSNQTMTGNSAGFDFGLKIFLTTDDGQTIESPLYLHQALDELRVAQQGLSRKIKFSHNWYKAKQNIARIYATIVNKRHDWFFKLAHELTNKYDYLYFENLNMNGMMRLWGHKVGDLARSEFMNILKYVANNKGKIVYLVDRFYPSSKTCSACKYIYQELQLSERRWTCINCGVVHDRDVNAAINIHREGASSLRLGKVRPV